MHFSKFLFHHTAQNEELYIAKLNSCCNVKPLPEVTNSSYFKTELQNSEFSLKYVKPFPLVPASTFI